MYKVILLLPEIYFFLSVLLIFLFGIISSLSSIKKYPNTYNSTLFLSIITLLYTFMLLINSVTYYFDFYMISKNQSTLLILELCTVLCTIILMTMSSYNKLLHINSFEYIVFILLSLGSLFILLSSIHFILIYLLLELQSITIVILLSINQYNRYSIEASIKYFILSSFSSLILLFGISIIYGSTGFMSIYEINLFFTHFDEIKNEFVSISIKISSIFILIGILFKIYSAPFHFWVPDIYEGAPMSVLVYISTIQFFVMVFFFLKIYYYILFDITKIKLLLIGITSIFTLVLGSIGALLQTKIKKVIGFSAISVNGFFLYSIIHNSYFVIQSIIIYLLVYMFTILVLLILLSNTIINNKVIDKYYDLFYIYKSNKVLSICITLLLFSISGIPPFIGFISKLFWLKSLITEYSILILLLLFIFLVISYYYLRLIKNIYDNNKKHDNYLYVLSKNNYESSAIAVFILLLLLYFILNPMILYNYAKIIMVNFMLIL